MYPCDSELLVKNTGNVKICLSQQLDIELSRRSARSAVRVLDICMNSLVSDSKALLSQMSCHIHNAESGSLDSEVTTLEFLFKEISTGKNSQSNGPWMMWAWASTTTSCQCLERSSLGQDWEVTHA